MGDLKKEETMVVGGGGEGENGEKDEKFIDGMAVMDFDMLCATVALQTEGGFYSSKGNNWGKLNNDDDGDDIDGGEFGGGVQRMWEGDVFDFLEDRRIALQTACCPCYRFGKNMGRAGLGHCFIQGTVYFILVITTLFSYITFTITRRHLFLYMALAFTVSAGTYFGYCRRQIRKQFNIRDGSYLLEHGSPSETIVFLFLSTLVFRTRAQVFMFWSSSLLLIIPGPCLLWRIIWYHKAGSKS
ncbi:uncharacterized protein LOC113287777 isoform X2 [Papaver somniferum]|uniref:uncharacterized protein LOC113287777 isoform X2 n=1 Tax=Papaver somniferum TaxID=3469 RepID=UPI000E6FB79D|nr:uncharacterized protein LOC113287777 isoform X2 [Papaver somniferum]